MPAPASWECGPVSRAECTRVSCAELYGVGGPEHASQPKGRATLGGMTQALRQWAEDLRLDEEPAQSDGAGTEQVPNNMEESIPFVGINATLTLEGVLDVPERSFSCPLGNGHNRYRALSLLEGVLLTQPSRVAGMSVLPLDDSTRGEAVPVLINTLLDAHGYSGSRVRAEQFAEEYTRRRPVVVCIVDDLRADDLRQARETMDENAFAIASLLSVQRNASATPVAGFAENVNDPSDARGWLNVGSYPGNRAGGFISGENQGDTFYRFEALRNDGRLQLWLTLHRDALNEPRDDFRFFRYFNVLEALGREMFGSITPLVNSLGESLMTEDRKPATTYTARGKVYALLDHLAAVTHTSQLGWCVEPETSLWSDIRIWTAIRDAVAHDGGLRPDVGNRVDGAKVLSERFDDTTLSFLGPYLRQISDASSSAILALLDGHLTFPSTPTVEETAN